jgi:hypothetical protein
VNLALIVSVLSFLISATTLYLTQLRRPRIRGILGPDLKIYHGHFADGPSTGLYLPVTFINTGPTTGTITRAALIVYREASPNQQFLMQWDQFVRMEPETYNYHAEEHCHAVPVAGKSAVHNASSGIKAPKLVMQSRPDVPGSVDLAAVPDWHEDLASP